MAYTFDIKLFSDLYKEVHGFRPSGMHTFYTAPPEIKQILWDRLLDEHEAELDRYHAHQEKQIKDFEALIESTIELGARTRPTAIEWILDAECLDKDSLAYGHGYITYCLDLPGTYLTEEFNSYAKKHRTKVFGE